MSKIPPINVSDLVPLEVTINEFIWDDYRKLVGNKIPNELNIRNYYKNDRFNGDSLGSLYKSFKKHVLRHKKKNGTFIPRDIETVDKAIWVTNNAIYNLCYGVLVEYITSMDILDLLEVQSHTKLTSAMDKVKKELSVSSIENAYRVLEDILSNDKTLDNNPVSKAFKGKNINSKQLRQVLGPIGFRTDINSYIYKTPIATSFTEGMRNIYDMAIESRSAAKALFFSKQAISKSETFAKHLQLLTSVITRVVHKDCGNKELREIFVRPSDHPSMSPDSKGDHFSLIGKHYKLNKSDTVFKVITEEDKSVIGKTIYIRTADTCKLKNPHHICSACLGEVSLNIPIHANLGHYSANVLMKPASQSILSIKHLITSAVASDAIIDSASKKIMRVSGPKYILDKDLIEEYDTVIIKLNKDEAFTIKDIRNKTDLQRLNYERASSIRSIYIETHKGDKIDKHTLTVGNVHRTGRLSLKFFEYALAQGYGLDTRGNYIITLDKWKLKSPFMVLPEIEFSYFTLFLNISTLIKTRTILKGGKSRDTPTTLALKLFDLCNTKLTVNMAYLEVIVYALTARDLSINDMSLGRNVKDPQLIPLTTAINNRGLGAGTAYGITQAKAVNPVTFLPTSKVDHPLDVLIRPVEALAGFDPLSRGDYNNY